MKIEVEAEITEIGARGDGIATTADGAKLFVPYTVPGDFVRVRLGKPRPDGFAGRMTALLRPGSGRGEPPCRHFGACGGCALQHLDTDHYRAWKVAILTKALERQGVVVDAVRPLAITPPGRRRRADFAAVRRKADLVLGFHGRESHQVIDLAECPVLLPEIADLLAHLRTLLIALLDPADSAGVVVTRTDSGLDLVVETGAQLGQKRRERLAEFAAAADLARIARRHPKGRGTEILIERRPVRVRFEEIPVSFPPGGFLQASAEGETALRQAVIEALGPAPRVADLYAGSGTFALPLAAEGRQVLAAEGDEDALAALDGAVRASAGRLRVKSSLRDLDRNPLGPDELGRIEGVVFDPPRNGARTQAAMLAESEVERVVAVSCNPATFARDARILIDGGYRLAWVQPVDQFLWSPHLELVGAFGRE